MGLIKTLNSWSGRISPAIKNIRELDREGVKFNWDDVHDKEFQEMKKHLEEVCKIHAYDSSLPLELYCDAAKTGGLGYVLAQPKGERHNIIYAGSTGLTPTQKRWSMGELELASIVFGI